MAPTFEVLGWPPDGPKLGLDYRRFAYAGKFVTPATGKAIARDPDGPDPPELDGDLPEPVELGDAVGVDDAIAALSFDADRTDPETLRLRYVTVRADRRGEGVGPRLVAFVAARAGTRGYDRLRIAVNNPFSYRALYRAGFAYAGETTGLAELLLERPVGSVGDRESARGELDRDPEAYRTGLDAFRERDLSAAEESYLDRVAGGDPPDVIESPADDGTATGSGR